MTDITLNSNLQQLTEYIDDWHSDQIHIDKSQRLIRNVALTSTKSKNGYRYSEQALRDAIALYENKPVFLDHAANLSRPHERSTRDLVGSITNPRFSQGRIRGDIRVLETESGKTFMALAESDTPAVGMSHVVLAQRSSDKTIVEKIHDVVSVDAVVFPATTSTFREHHHQQSPFPLPGSLESILTQIDEQLPGHVCRLAAPLIPKSRRVGLFPKTVIVEIHSTGEKQRRLHALDWNFEDGQIIFGTELTPLTRNQSENETWNTADLSAVIQSIEPKTETDNDDENQLKGELESILVERDQLKAQLDKINAEKNLEQQQQEIDELVERSRLPSFCVTESFRQQLLQAPNEKSRQTLITERQQLLSFRPNLSPVSRERIEYSRPALDDIAIIAAIKQHHPSALAGIS